MDRNNLLDVLDHVREKWTDIDTAANMIMEMYAEVLKRHSQICKSCGKNIAEVCGGCVSDIAQETGDAAFNCR